MKKSVIRILSLALCLALCLSVLPSFAAAADKKITSVSVEIGKPVGGDKPSYDVSLPGDASYRSKDENMGRVRNGVYWYNITDDEPVNPGTDRFEAGKDYFVSIYLTEKDGYVFDFDNMTATLNGTKPRNVFNIDGALCLEYIYERVPTRLGAVSVEIDEPKAGKKPSYAATFSARSHCYGEGGGDSYYRDGIAWYNVTDGKYVDPESGYFEGRKEYEVRIYLVPKAGYTFAGRHGVDDTVNGRKAETYSVGGGQIYLKCAFDPLPEPKKISTVSVEIAEPVAGKKPSYELTLPDGAPYYNSDYSSNTFRNDICWFNETDAENVYPESTVFEAGKVYRVEIYLTEKDGYVFDYGNVTAKVNGRAAGEAEEWADSLLLTYTFDPAPELINSVSVKIAEPVAGEKPSYTATFPSGAHYHSAAYNTSPFRNNIAWWNKTDGTFVSPQDGVFEEGKQYTAEVFVNADEGWAFEAPPATLNGRVADTLRIDSTEYRVCYTFTAGRRPAGKWGDVDGSGVVDSDDAMLILRYDVKKIGKDKLKNFALADVDGSGVVDSDDAMLVLRFDVKKISKFPVEK